MRLGSHRELTAQVLAREAEFGVGDLGSAASDGRLLCEPLGEHPVHFFCRPGHPLVGRSGLTLAELATVPVVATRGSVRLGASLGRLRGRAGAPDEATGDFVPAWEVDSVGLAKGVVASSDAIGVAALSQIADELHERSLALVPFRADWLMLSYGFIMRRDLAVSPGMKAFMAAFREREAVLGKAEKALAKRHLRGVLAG